MNDDAAPRACIVCGVAPRPMLRLAPGVPLLRCPRCGLGWWHWPALDARAFYDRAYFQSADTAKGYDDYAALEAGVRRTARARLRRIAALLASGSRAAGEPARSESGGPAAPALFEIGCGTGLLLDEARRAGWRVAGLEVSEYAAGEAQRRGLTVTCGASEDAHLPDASYDCVALFDVIEHLRDPAGVLRAAGRALRPGGVLAVSTGDVTSLCARLSGPRWHLYTLPEHLYFFSPRALAQLMRRAGCAPRRLTREVNWVPVRYLVERLRKSTGGGAGLGFRAGGRPAARAGRRGRPVRPAAGPFLARYGNAVVPATLFDVMGMYAIRCPDVIR